MTAKRKSRQMDEDIEIKKLRNRTSQQAFRRRQSDYIKQLERKAKACKSDNERIIELEEENTSLRESLIQCHTKLESLRTTICTLSDGLARTLDDPHRITKTTPKSRQISNLREKKSSHELLHISTNNEIANPGEKVQDISLDIPQLFSSDKSNTLNTPVDIDITAESNTSEFACSGLVQEQEPTMKAPLSNIWPHEYQMEPAWYVDCSAANDAISQQLKIEWSPSNTPFSEEVDALRSILKAKWDGMERDPECYSHL